MRTSLLTLTTATALVLGAWLLAAPSKDDTMDWLLGTKATTAPATRPAALPTQPSTPFEDRPINPEARKGVVILSNDERIPGLVSTTREKPLRFWDAKDVEYKDVPFTLIKSLEAKILWERDQPEWHFKESGSDIKEFTGKTYPARELTYEVTLLNDQKFTGGVVAPIFISGSGQTLNHVLYKRQKGDVGKTLKDLVYIKKIELE